MVVEFYFYFFIMSQGPFTTVDYASDVGGVFPIQIQPETETLTLDGVANVAAGTTIPTNTPSAKVSGGRRSIGVNARLVRFRFSTATVPPGYSPSGVLTVPVLQKSVFDGYGKGQSGTYTLEGTAYDVEFIGKTPETIN